MSDYRLETAISKIFGEPLGASAAHEQQQQALDKANRTHDAFFSQAAIEHLIGRKGQRTTTPQRTATELQRAIGIEPDQAAGGTFTKSLERPLLVNDRLGNAAKRLIAKEVGKLRRTATGSILSLEAGLRGAWNAFADYATGAQKSIAETAIRECDSSVVQALVRECMIASEGEL